MVQVIVEFVGTEGAATKKETIKSAIKTIKNTKRIKNVFEALKKNFRAKSTTIPPITKANIIPGKPKANKRRETKNSIIFRKRKDRLSEVREIKPVISSIKTIKGDSIILFLFIN